MDFNLNDEAGTVCQPFRRLMASENREAYFASATVTALPERFVKALADMVIDSLRSLKSTVVWTRGVVLSPPVWMGTGASGAPTYT